MTKEELVALRDATDEILDIIESAPEKFTEPINWSDLLCVHAAWVRDHAGKEWAEVLIEEADPNCYRLQAEVRSMLAARGYPRVDVRTEW